MIRREKKIEISKDESMSESLSGISEYDYLSECEFNDLFCTLSPFFQTNFQQFETLIFCT